VTGRNVVDATGRTGGRSMRQVGGGVLRFWDRGRAQQPIAKWLFGRKKGKGGSMRCETRKEANQDSSSRKYIMKLEKKTNHAISRSEANINFPKTTEGDQ